ncbi:MAG: hypothetical protein FJ144_15115 [Deltaproteobacteria bacterium]|nr:hypothetical protein [Deltaproteobacteria bacterium]
MNDRIDRNLQFPIERSAAWKGDELASRADWIHALTAAEIADVERVVASVRRLGVARSELTREDVAFEALAPAVSAWRETLAQGRGFVLVRGLPAERLDVDDAVAPTGPSGCPASRELGHPARADGVRRSGRARAEAAPAPSVARRARLRRRRRAAPAGHHTRLTP